MYFQIVAVARCFIISIHSPLILIKAQSGMVNVYPKKVPQLLTQSSDYVPTQPGHKSRIQQ